MATGDGIMVIPSDVEVNETVLAAMRSIQGMDTHANFISPIIEVPTETGRTYKFNDQHDKATIDDEVGPFDSSPIVEEGVSKSTYACTVHRRGIVLAAENMTRNDSGLNLSLAAKAEKVVGALEKRRAYNILTSLKTGSNYSVKVDINATSKKWGLADSNPQDDVERAIEAMCLRLSLSEAEMGNVRIFAGKDAHRVMKTKVISSIHAQAGDSKAIQTQAITDHFGYGEYRAAFGSYNASGKGSAVSSRAYMFDGDIVVLFYCPDNPTAETPQFKCTLRYMGTDGLGKPTSGGWVDIQGDPAVAKIIHRDWRVDTTFDWSAATLLYNVV